MSKISKNGRIDITTPSGGSYNLKEGSPIKDNSSYSLKNPVSSLFSIFILILFFIVFSHYLRTGTFINFSFKSLIDYFSGMPDVSVSFATIDLTITADWGAFNFLRSFLNAISYNFEVMWTMSGMLAQAFVVIGYLLGLFFI